MQVNYTLTTLPSEIPKLVFVCAFRQINLISRRHLNDFDKHFRNISLIRHTFNFFNQLLICCSHRSLSSSNAKIWRPPHIK